MSGKFKNYLKNNRRFFLLAAAAFLLFGALAGPLFAFTMMNLSELRSQQIQAKNIGIAAAISDGDYATWNSLVTDQRLKSKINKDNFTKYVTMLDFLKQGKINEADTVAAQIGLKDPVNATGAVSRAITEAIEKGDYSSWRTAVGGALPMITDSNFKDYGRAYLLNQKGETKHADLILKAIGAKVSTPTEGSSDHFGS